MPFRHRDPDTPCPFHIYVMAHRRSRHIPATHDPGIIHTSARDSGWAEYAPTGGSVRGYAGGRTEFTRAPSRMEVDVELTNELVYIVDDEANIGDALSALLRASGKRVRIFTSGQDFVDFSRHDSCACLILDLKMPGLSGLEVQKLISATTSLPVIFLTGRGDIPSTVRAMKGGAADFLTKPIDEEVLLASVDRALLQDRRNRQEAAEQAKLLARYQSLTPREREVLPLLVGGLLNKQAAFELGITEYTVQIHRGHIMRKMEAESFATLVKLAGKLSLEPASIYSGKV